MKSLIGLFSLVIIMLFSCKEEIWLHDGNDGYSTLLYFDAAAQMKIYYLDRDRNMALSSADTVLYREAKEGLKIVQDGKCYNLFQVTGIIEKLVATVCNGTNGTNGTNGENGFSFVSKTCPYLDYNGKVIGQTISFYLDKDRDGILSSGDEYSNSIIVLNGQNGNSATALVAITLEYDFQGAGATYFNSTGFELNGFIFSESDGALYLHESCGSVLFPPFIDNMDLLSLMFNYGSENPYDVVVKAVYADESEEVIGEVHLDGNPNFQKNVYSTYSLFEYHANLENIEFKDIKQIKIEGKRDDSRKCIPTDLFIDQVVILLLDRNH